MAYRIAHKEAGNKTAANPNNTNRSDRTAENVSPLMSAPRKARKDFRKIWKTAQRKIEG